MTKLLLPVVTFSLLFAVSCGNNGARELVRRDVNGSASQIKTLIALTAESDSLPRTVKNGSIKMIDAYDWTSGFYPGTLWKLYDLTGDSLFLNRAITATAKLYPVKDYRSTHDLGFMIFCSYGEQYAALHDTLSVRVIDDAAESLYSRYAPAIGLIRSWDFGEWNYPVIIDNMMNLEMLFWASRNTGDDKYRDAAIRHADRTMENHFRPDGSSFHVVSYRNDGTVESQGTFQGYSDSSSWARGQAWGLYGYTMCYRYTKLDRYLSQARRIADYIISHTDNIDDAVPYWDYDAPNIPDAPRDASAAAVTSSALFELGTVTGDKKYLQFAERLLRSLSSDKYMASGGDNGGFILKHCVGHLPADSEVDVPLNYADYYYLEAVQRYAEMNKITPRKLYNK